MEFDEKLLDVTEAAGLCRLRVSTLRRWVGERRVPFVKLGRRVLFRHEDIKELITQNLVPALNETTPAQRRRDECAPLKARG
jgi:excisionase family DNA binding protein